MAGGRGREPAPAGVAAAHRPLRPGSLRLDRPRDDADQRRRPITDRYRAVRRPGPPARCAADSGRAAVADALDGNRVSRRPGGCRGRRGRRAAGPRRGSGHRRSGDGHGRRRGHRPGYALDDRLRGGGGGRNGAAPAVGQHRRGRRAARLRSLRRHRPLGPVRRPARRPSIRRRACVRRARHTVEQHERRASRLRQPRSARSRGASRSRPRPHQPRAATPTSLPGPSASMLPPSPSRAAPTSTSRRQ